MTPRTLFIFIVLFFAFTVTFWDALAEARPEHHKESYYQQIWCDNAGGETEHINPDKTRVDCLTTSHAIEFDFAKKWAEAIGQALYYSSQTGLPPGIVLIMEKESDDKFLLRLKTTINHWNLPIKVWLTGAGANDD